MIYIIHNDQIFDCTCKLGVTDVLDKCKEYGCVLLSQTQFKQKDINYTKDDQIVVFISIKDDCRAKLASAQCKKFVWSGDEAHGSGPFAYQLFVHEQELKKHCGVRCVITAQSTERNLKFLNDIHYQYLIFDPCTTYDIEQNFEHKKYDICISGTASDAYPLRKRLRDLLNNSKIFKVKLVPFIGYMSKDKNAVVGTKFYEAISQSWLGLVTHVGKHDRFVAKYLEFAKTWVLPVGNYPSSMHPDVQKLVLDIDPKLSNDDIIKLVKTTLEDKEQLKNRITAYHNHYVEHGDIDIIVPKLLKQIVEFEQI